MLKIQKLKITHGKKFYSQKCFMLKTYVLKVEEKKKKIQTENDAAGQVTQQVLDFLVQMWEVLY